jgi:hypothetical protein
VCEVGLDREMGKWRRGCYSCRCGVGRSLDVTRFSASCRWNWNHVAEYARHQWVKVTGL